MVLQAYCSGELSRFLLKFQKTFIPKIFSPIFLLFHSRKICDACSVRLTFREKLNSNEKKGEKRVQSNLLLDSTPLEASLGWKKIKESDAHASLPLFSEMILFLWKYLQLRMKETKLKPNKELCRNS